jgi:hypothetical protein
MNVTRKKSGGSSSVGSLFNTEKEVAQLKNEGITKEEKEEIIQQIILRLKKLAVEQLEHVKNSLQDVHFDSANSKKALEGNDIEGGPENDKTEDVTEPVSVEDKSSQKEDKKESSASSDTRRESSLEEVPGSSEADNGSLKEVREGSVEDVQKGSPAEVPEGSNVEKYPEDGKDSLVVDSQETSVPEAIGRNESPSNASDGTKEGGRKRTRRRRRNRNKNTLKL